MADDSTQVTARQFTGDAWRLWANGLFVVDPTNLFVKRDGRNVMGAGISAQAARRMRELPHWYGTRLLAEVRPARPAGEPVERTDLAGQLLIVNEERRMIFAPVKLNWWQPAELWLVERSLAEIGAWLDAHAAAEIALPWLGCGNGGRDWESEVKPLVRTFLGRLAEHARRRVVIVSPAERLPGGPVWSFKRRGW